VKPKRNKKAHRAEQAKAKAAELLVSKSGGEFPGGLVIEPVKRPDPDLSLFTLHPNNSKAPAGAVRAPSLTAAIYYAKARHPQAKVRPDDGLVARLGLAVVEVDKGGAVVGSAVVPASDLAKYPDQPDAGTARSEPAGPKRARKPKAAEVRP
jgi:hypothetical protein